MRQDFFDFQPTHKLIFTGNHKPGLRSCDEAIRRRFLLVPFTVEIPEAERDPDLAERLKAEWPAILGWMIDGCLDWRRNGLMVPAAVRYATEEYMQDQDSLSEWLEACSRNDTYAFTPTSELFRSWKSWCEQRNQSANTERAFVYDLVDRGFIRERRNFGRGFMGLSIRAAAATDPLEGQG